MSARPPQPADPTASKITAASFQAKRDAGERLVELTAYDFPTARAAEAAMVDSILVGDSLAMVVLGHENTLAVTMDEMLHHARAVRRGARRPLLIGDMPFLSYQTDEHEALRNAGRFIKEAGMEAVKLEGGREFAGTIRAIVRAGIPVQGHIGLQPQSLHRMGGWRVQGRTADAAAELVEAALALEDAGCFSIVIESVPARVAERITERLSIPTIGIGAGSGTSGQVLVCHDILGLSERAPRFARQYRDLSTEVIEAFRAYRDDVLSGAFPALEHSYSMAEEEWQAFRDADARVHRRLG
jgi:3-methyl-2-oxobutanoate hydroxymethyltransferase